MIAAFQEIDADGDGELTADEIYQALARNDANVSLERIHEVMERADKDHNGTISQQEYLDAVAEDILPPSWLGAWLGKLAKGVAAAFAGPEPEAVATVSIDAPQGALGLVFERDSAVICRIKDESPLLGQVELGWTLVSINSNGSVLDTSTLDGAAVTNLLFARAEVARKLQFQKTEIKVSAPVAPPVGQVVAVQPEWQPPPFVRTPEAAQIVAWQHPEAAALEALRSFFTKLASLDGDTSTITKAEFAVCCADPAVGPQITNQDAVFDCARPVWKSNFTGTRLTGPFAHRSRRRRVGRDLPRRAVVRRRRALHGRYRPRHEGARCSVEPGNHRLERGPRRTRGARQAHGRQGVPEGAEIEPRLAGGAQRGQ